MYSVAKREDVVEKINVRQREETSRIRSEEKWERAGGDGEMGGKRDLFAPHFAFNNIIVALVYII